MAAHICNLRTQEAKGGSHEFGASLDHIGNKLSQKQNQPKKQKQVSPQECLPTGALDPQGTWAECSKLKDLIYET